MFAKQFAILSSLALLAVATPFPQALSQCNTGSMQCCNSVQNSTTQGVASLAGLLGINLQGLNIPIGLTCSGISVSVVFVVYPSRKLAEN